MSYISAGTTTTTSLIQGGDTTGNLVFATGNANTTALTITNTQNATFAANLAVTGNVTITGALAYANGAAIGGAPVLNINSQQNYGGFQ